MQEHEREGVVRSGRFAQHDETDLSAAEKKETTGLSAGCWTPFRDVLRYCYNNWSRRSEHY